MGRSRTMKVVAAVLLCVALAAAFESEEAVAPLEDNLILIQQGVDPAGAQESANAAKRDAQAAEQQAEAQETAINAQTAQADSAAKSADSTAKNAENKKNDAEKDLEKAKTEASAAGVVEQKSSADAAQAAQTE